MKLYSTGCPKCEVLKKKLRSKNLNFSICDDMMEMKEKNITTLPVLELNGKLLSFKEAVDWINQTAIIQEVS